MAGGRAAPPNRTIFPVPSATAARIRARHSAIRRGMAPSRLLRRPPRASFCPCRAVRGYPENPGGQYGNRRRFLRHDHQCLSGRFNHRGTGTPHRPGKQDMPIWLTIVSASSPHCSAPQSWRASPRPSAHPDRAGGAGSDRRLPHLRDTRRTPRAQSRLTTGPCPRPFHEPAHPVAGSAAVGRPRCCSHRTPHLELAGPWPPTAPSPGSVRRSRGACGGIPRPGRRPLPQGGSRAAPRRPIRNRSAGTPVPRKHQPRGSAATRQACVALLGHG